MSNKNNNINEMDKMNEFCEGCFVYETHRRQNTIQFSCVGYIIKDIECPCINCLVKMICGTPCDKLERRRWPTYNKAIEVKHENWR